jgi:phage-related protein
MAYFDNTDPCWIPDAGFAKEQSWRLRISQFGDGYQQRILDGINALDKKFTVSFYRAQQHLVDIDNYLAGMNGSAFPFVDPITLINYSVWCDTWQITWDIKRKRDPVTFNIAWYGTLSAEFNKANGITVAEIAGVYTVLPT